MHDFISDSLNNYYINIDKIFTLNFTMLAFILTSITILLLLQDGMIKKFKEANLLNDVMEYFNKAMQFSFVSGSWSLLIWLLNIKNFLLISNVISAISIILLICSLYYVYQSYKFLIFFVKKQ